MVEKNKKYDVIIAGGGPAGLSSLLWCADLGLNAILLEKKSEFGGQLLRIHNAIKNHLGVDAANGRELCDIFLRQVAEIKMGRLTEAEIVKADLAQKKVTLADGTTYEARAIIIATGVRRRKLMVPGENEFRGRGILESGVKAKNDVRGRNVVVVGGGDAALENAIILSETANRVVVVHRRGEFKARKEFVQKTERTGNIDFCFDTRVTQIRGKETVNSVELEHLITGKIASVEIDAVLIRIGTEPNTELFRGQLALDHAGFVKIDETCAAGLHGVYAVGDVANRKAPTISAAAGQGSSAVKTIFSEINSR